MNQKHLISIFFTNCPAEGRFVGYVASTEYMATGPWNCDADTKSTPEHYALYVYSLSDVHWFCLVESVKSTASKREEHRLTLQQNTK